MSSCSVSASQIDRAKGCMRSWAWRYIAHVKEPDKVATTFGTDLHKVAEDYLNKGKAPDVETEVGRRFLPGLRYLPRAGVGGVEAEFDATISGVSYGTAIDWIGPAVLVPDCPPEAMDWPAVIDHKTAKKPGDYGLKVAEDFLSNAQAMLYAVVALVRKPEAGGVYLRWVQYASEGPPKAKAFSVALTRAEVIEAFKGHVHAWAREIGKLRDKPRHPLTVIPNKSNCHKYKSKYKNPSDPTYNAGCYYQNLCTDVTDEDKIFALMEDPTNMDLLAMVQAEAAKQTTPDPINPAPLAAAQVVSASSAPAPGGGTDLLGMLQAAQGTPAPSAAAAVNTNPITVPVQGTPVATKAAAAPSSGEVDLLGALTAQTGQTHANQGNTSRVAAFGPHGETIETYAPVDHRAAMTSEAAGRAAIAASIVTDGQNSRDSIAHTALAKLMERGFYNQPEDAVMVADLAYEIADAMVTARGDKK